MKQDVKTGISEYSKGATAPNRGGLFARVAPAFISGKFGEGSLFSMTRYAHQENI